MKNFFKYSFLIILVVLLIGSIFKENETQHNSSLDSNVLIVESNNEIEVDEITTQSPNNSANIFAKIGAFISNIIYKLFEFIFSIISKVLIKSTFYTL